MHENYLGKLEEELKLRGLSNKTIFAYQIGLRQFFNWRKDGIELVTMDAIKVFQRYLIESSYSPRTINLRVASVRFFYRNVLNRPWATLPWAMVKVPFKPPRFLSAQEVNEIVRFCNNDIERTLLLTLYSTGLRVEELVSVKIEDLSKDSSVFSVVGKGGRSRIVPLCDELRHQLRLYWWFCRRPMRTGLLFVSPKRHGEGFKTNEIYRIFVSAKAKAGIKKSGGVHILRHSFASRMLELGVSLREIQLILGHAQLRTTEQYTHLSAAKLGSMKNPLTDYRPGRN